MVGRVALLTKEAGDACPARSQLGGTGVADRPLTLMAVHAHPDDEASSTGGILAKYADEGVTTVLVTCTNGELGDSGGVKPGEDGHRIDDVVHLRAGELEASCKVLGVTHLEMLGYHDSGMMGWPQNDAPGAFWSVPVDAAAAKLAALIDKYRPDVVVTYDENGFYGHPDHIQAHRITVAALGATGSQAKLYYPTIRRSGLGRFSESLSELGVEVPAIDESEFGSPDEVIAAEVDCSAYAQQKFDSLAAHASQAENIFFLKLPMTTFTEMFGREAFIRERPPHADDGVEDDLFAGLR
jgi:LmbE family N-acetylglucosaminyl deacetylase